MLDNRKASSASDVAAPSITCQKVCLVCQTAPSSPFSFIQSTLFLLAVAPHTHFSNTIPVKNPLQRWSLLNISRTSESRRQSFRRQITSMGGGVNPPIQIDEMVLNDDFRRGLERLGLGEYYNGFVAEAFDSWEVLAQITEDDLYVVCFVSSCSTNDSRRTALGVRLGHRRVSYV